MNADESRTPNYFRATTEHTEKPRSTRRGEGFLRYEPRTTNFLGQPRRPRSHGLARPLRGRERQRQQPEQSNHRLLLRSRRRSRMNTDKLPSRRSGERRRPEGTCEGENVTTCGPPPRLPPTAPRRPASAGRRFGLRWLDTAFPPLPSHSQSGVKPPHSKAARPAAALRGKDLAPRQLRAVDAATTGAGGGNPPKAHA